MSDFGFIILSAIIGYGLGSVPFGYLLTRVSGGGDIRDGGSGGTGATNVLRSGGKLLAVLTLILDAAKGFLALYLANMLADQAGMWVAGIAAVAGHLFPVWLQWKGGKGVAVFLGLMLQLSPLVGILAPIVWIIAALIRRQSSAASLITIIICLPLLWLVGEVQSSIAVIIMGGLIFYAHRENIERLRNGTEPKIGKS